MKRFVLVMAFAVSLLPGALFSQGGVKVKITATGTGNTTGHIANLTIHNKEKYDIRINEQAVYIPSDGQYQPYISTIPETTIPPGVTTIPLDGYCADVTTPPVPTGVGMPPVEDWVATVPDIQPRPGGGGINVIEKIVPQFSVQDIPGIIQSEVFKPGPPTEFGVPSGPLFPLGVDIPLGGWNYQHTTWPGTDILVGGVLDPNKDPLTSGPVLIDALQNIANAFDSLRQEGQITTPFSGDPPTERDAVIQQTLWIFTAGLSGKKYEKEDFNNKVFEQFVNNTGLTVSTIPGPDKIKLDEGVDAFWNTFMATGVEAKVLRTPDKTTSANTVPVQDSPGVPEEYKKPEDRECICDTIRMNLVIRHIHEGAMVTDVDEPVTLTKETDELKRTIQNVDNDEKLTFTLSDVEAKCSCSYGEVNCQDYGFRNEKGGLGNRDEVKMRTDNTENCDVETKPVKTAGTSFSFVIKADASKKDNQEGVSIDIIVTAHCKSDDCNPGRSDKCEKTITIKLTEPAE